MRKHHPDHLDSDWNRFTRMGVGQMIMRFVFSPDYCTGFQYLGYPSVNTTG